MLRAITMATVKDDKGHLDDKKHLVYEDNEVELRLMDFELI